MARASALAHSEAHSRWQMHGVGILCPAVEHMTARLGTHAVGVAIPHPFR